MYFSALKDRSHSQWSLVLLQIFVTNLIQQDMSQVLLRVEISAEQKAIDGRSADRGQDVGELVVELSD